ncbi:MAG: helix-turn-helix domain-containing protein [Oscillospiraceae bacterium]|nr:helix-turn-helix domain-containing protein [Oscillospiraceae bacterium]
MLLYCHGGKKGGRAKNKIKFFRGKKGLTLEYVAYVSKTSISYLCQLENGNKTNPSLKIMEGIAKALEETINEVFF